MSNLARELDVRSLPPPKRHPEIFGLFDALEPGAAFVLVNDHDPKPLLYQFQAERPRHFDWSVLEAGPERFRIEIRSRTAKGMRNVSEYLEGDHRRLDAILQDVRTLVMVAAFSDAKTRFGEFSCGLNRHIDIEEQVLFPTFERMTGMTAGPTTVMRAEHVEIRSLLDKVVTALGAGDAASTGRAISSVAEVLSAHNMKEEHILYPMSDQAAGSDQARDDLVKRLQAF